MKYPCRCSAKGQTKSKRCHARKTLVKHPLEYKIPPKCDSCSGRSWVVDSARMKRLDSDRGAKCNCDGKPHLHRYGQKGCNFREEKIVESFGKEKEIKESDVCIW